MNLVGNFLYLILKEQHTLKASQNMQLKTIFHINKPKEEEIYIKISSKSISSITEVTLK